MLALRSDCGVCLTLGPVGAAGERQLSEHQLGDPDVGPAKGQTALLPQRAPGEGVRREVPRLPAEQLPQPASLLAATLPQQGQGQHLSGECEQLLLFPFHSRLDSRGRV